MNEIYAYVMKFTKNAVIFVRQKIKLEQLRAWVDNQGKWHFNKNKKEEK